MKKELSKPPSIPWGVQLNPKTKTLMDGNVDAFATPASQCYVIFAQSGTENQILSIEDAEYDKESDSPNVMLDDTDSVCEPPPCHVDLMN